MKNAWKAAVLLATSALAAPMLAAQGTQTPEETKLLRDPALSDSALAFAYAGDIWIAAPDGSNPVRLTSHPADERDPIFSPDGTRIAYTANYDGNDDVFVIDVRGGEPQRLTWYPGSDEAIDWLPDGETIAMVSTRERRSGRSGQLFHVGLDGELPKKVSEAVVNGGAYDEAGRVFANVPSRSGNAVLTGGVNGWRGYRGGLSPSLQLIDFEAGTKTEIPGDRTTEFDPVWMDGQLYFLSDRWNTRSNIFRYDPASGEVSQITQEADWDIRNMTAKNGRIVYEAGGTLHSLDVASGSTTPLSISLVADLPARRAGWRNVSGQMTYAALSPSAKRVAVTARGEVFTVPTDKGTVRNISQSPSTRNYSAIWSTDGTQLAYITDDGAGQSLVIEDQSGIEPARTIALGEDFYELIEWGNAGKHIVYSSNTLTLNAMDVETGTSWRIATSPRRNGSFDAVISPKGRWMAFTTRGGNNNAALNLYDLETRQTYPVSRGYADVGLPTFAKDGKLLFFTASTNAGSFYAGLDMTTQDRPYRSALYAAVLEADGKSPLAPILANEEDDEDKSEAENGEKGNGKNGDNTDGGKESVKVDPSGLERRIVALPMAEAGYGSLATAKDGALFVVERPQPGAATGPGTGGARSRLLRFDFEEREAKPVGQGILNVSTDADGDKLLLLSHEGNLLTADAGEKVEPKPINMSGVRMYVDPLEEWKQIFGDVWRMEKAYFYDPNLHGLDWEGVRAKFEPLLPHLGRREDLNELLVEMTGEMGVGHNYVGGGDVYDNSSAAPGLLGADLAIEDGRYRIKRIYTGEEWNPTLSAPLAAPGVDAKEGDYIIAVNGVELTGSDNIYAALSGSRGTQIALTVAATPGAERRTSTVVPTDGESLLRLWSWIEDNRKRVDEATGGRVAYVYMPNTAGAGYTLFNRMYFAQTDKEALILDERSNGGGQAANYIIDVLSRKWLAGWKDREGLDWATPGGGIYGPKVMLIDQDAGSGGDWMPYAFRESGLGTLIGTRTWGGLIGISANPGLMDGGTLTVPFFRFFDTDGRFTIENEGVAPDIRVELDPIALDRGQDTQLEAAIATVLQQLEGAQSPVKPAPPYPTEIGK
ncbi:MAG: PDZ domain-containing protein [Erythrobacter sp.]|uniref:S41 family peptidase n=1 Tax=Erythrobacter sp. TaxID=1042 RepID=UPI002635BA4A|nr:S41 family peptidase [Erythrobacter sp.]MDJ0976900.1 PDZ domain-containing protein [Erythrobacter sp.]